MFILPFIYFAFLSYYLYRRQEGMTISVYMSLLYAFTALCAVIDVLFEFLGEDGGILYDNANAEFGFIPTVVYCAVLTATIWPFTRFNTTCIKTVHLENPRVFDIFGVFIILLSLLNLYLVADSTMDILNGNFAEVRKSMEAGEESLAQIKAQSLPFGISYIYLLNVVTIFGLPLAFYNLSKKRMPWWFNALLLFASLSQPIAGIQTADRTESAFLGLMAVFTLILFWHKLGTKIKVALGLASLPVVIAVGVYVSMVSSDRFEKTYNGPAVSLMQYVGQNYINFCYFWENAKSDYTATEREFPLLNRIFTGVVNDGDRRNERSAEQSFFISVFPSFIGDLYIDLTFAGMLLWVLAYIALCYKCIPDTEDPDTEVQAADYLTVFLLGIIPTFGIFYYRFHTFKSTLMIIIVMIVIALSKYSFSSESSADENSSNHSDL